MMRTLVRVADGIGAANSSTSSAARAAGSCAAAHAASSPARRAQPPARPARARPPGRRPRASRSAAAGARRRRPSRRARRSRSCRRPRARDDRAAARQRAHERAVAAVADDDVAARHRPRVGDPVDEPRVGRARRSARGGGAAVPAWRARGPAASASPSSAARSSGARGPATSTARRARAARRPAAARPRRTAAPTAAARRRASRGRPGARVLELRERRRRGQLRARCRRARRSSGGSPSAPARLVELRRARAPGPRSIEPVRRARHSARPTAVRGSRAPIEYGGKPRLGARVDVGDERRDAARPRSSPASAGAEREDVGDDHVGRAAPARSGSVSRARAHHRLVGLQRPLARREDVVLRRRRERMPSRLDVSLPALPRLQRDVVAARAPARGPAR